MAICAGGVSAHQPQLRRSSSSQARPVETFVPGEQVEVFSVSENKWKIGRIAEIAPDGTVKVEYGKGTVKYITPDQQPATLSKLPKAEHHAQRSPGHATNNGSPYVGQAPTSPKFFGTGQTPTSPHHSPSGMGGFHLPSGGYGAQSAPLAATKQEIQQQNGVGKSVPLADVAQQIQQQHGICKLNQQQNQQRRNSASSQHGDNIAPERDQRARSPKASKSPRSEACRDVTPCPPRERGNGSSRNPSPRHATKSLVPYGMGRHSHPENGGDNPVRNRGASDSEKKRHEKQKITMPAEPPEAPSTSSTSDVTTELYCNEGHLMRAKVVREVWNRISWWHYQTDCDVCGERITSKHARYCCKECRYSVCMKCTSKWLAVNRKKPRTLLPPSASVSSVMSVSAPGPGRVLPGDVLLVGPDKWGIHHAVLIVGKMKRETEAAEMIKHGWPEIQHMDIYSCPTIESTGQNKGEDTVWYPAMYFFARDPKTKDAILVADMPQSSNTIELCEEVPVKLLLHPCRPGHSGPLLDLSMFRRSVKQGAKDSQKWSFKTAAKGIMSRRKTTSRLNGHDFPDQESRRKMMDEVHKRWETRPICTSVIIMVWQRYFELVAGEGGEALDLAAKNILKWMPLFCDSTLPSALIKELSNCNWVMRGNIDA